MLGVKYEMCSRTCPDVFVEIRGRICLVRLEMMLDDVFSDRAKMDYSSLFFLTQTTHV